MGGRFPLSISVDLTYNYNIFVLDYGVCIATFLQLVHRPGKLVTGDLQILLDGWLDDFTKFYPVNASQFNHI